MRYFKNTLVLVSIMTALLFSVKSGYAAEEGYSLKAITATSTQSLEIELNKSAWIKDSNINSDLKVYQDIAVKDSIKDTTNTKMVKVNLKDTLSKWESYSILSISGVEWSIEFKIGDSLENKEIQNSALDGEEQWIKKILIKDASTIEITFIKDLADEEFDFKVYKNVAVDSISNWDSDTKLDVVLKDSLEDNSNYVGTVTLFEGGSDKIDIDNGIYDFMTDALSKYVEKTKTTSSNTDSNSDKKSDEKSLEDTLLAALDGSSDLNSGAELLDWEQEIQNELNSAWEDPANRENTQLENVALGSGETPDTGAETWVLVLLTFIINTFYFLSRRKRLIQA